MFRHLISRSQQFLVLVALMCALATAVLTTVQPNLIDGAPAPVQVADGWGDPTGG